MKAAVVRTLLASSALVLLSSGTAYAETRADTGEVGVQSGCAIFPCGALNNRTSSWVSVKWSDDDVTWKFSEVAPGTKKGGFWNDRIDVDFFFVDRGCRAYDDNSTVYYGPAWHKISSDETVTLVSYSCLV